MTNDSETIQSNFNNWTIWLSSKGIIKTTPE